MRGYLKKALWRMRRFTAGWDTAKEFFLFCIDCIVFVLSHKRTHLHLKSIRNRLKKKYLVDGKTYIFKEVRLPALDSLSEEAFWGYTFEDIFLTYIQYGDCYNEADMVSYYDYLYEGTYCLRNEHVDVVVEPGDIVLDAGSWIGEFAAYASAKGAVAYAFEPSDANFDYLLKTSELNKNIYPVKKGVSNVIGRAMLSSNGSSDDAIVAGQAVGSRNQSIEVTTIDAFVKEHGLTRVNFIKADIEGHERYMLEGAKETLKKFAPKLAICTYHLPDDPVVLEKIIKEANPNYNVVQKRKKLYASVPQNL